MFSGCTVPSDSKETHFGISDLEGFASTGKNSRIVLVPFRAGKCVPRAV